MAVANDQGLAGGRTVIQGNVVAGQDFVGRDKIVQYYLQFTDAEETLLRIIASLVNLDEPSAVKASGLHALQPSALRQLREIQAAGKLMGDAKAPMSGDSAYYYGMIAARNRDYDEALAYFQLVREGDAKFADACEAIAWLQQSLANIDMQRQNYTAAREKLAVADAALNRISHPSPRALALHGFIAKSLAQIAERHGELPEMEARVAEATDYFESALKVQPDDAGALNGLANCYLMTGRLDEAIAASQKAIELSPNYRAAFNDLAIIYELKMEADPGRCAEWLAKATAAWEKAIELAAYDPMSAEDYPDRVQAHLSELRTRC